MTTIPHARPVVLDAAPVAPAAVDAATAEPGALLQEVLATGGVRSLFQPIVDLDSGAVVGHEALSRGPVGTAMESPLALFDAAREAGMLARLDEACRLTAFRTASALGLASPSTIFVNVEPEVLDHAPLADLQAVADAAPGGLRVVLEITERALATRPAELLRTVERVRELGWGIALDDVGAEPASLAFMALLRPDVVKLDLSLVQRRASPAVAEIMNAVNAHAERTGAVVLAEGIETEEHLAAARALGASLGQGWLLGRPTATPEVGAPERPIRLSGSLVTSGLTSGLTPGLAPTSPFSCLPPGVVLRRSPKRLLIELSKHLEREAMRLGETCVVASTFQYREHFTPATTQRYRDLVESTGFVCALGAGMGPDLVPGLRGATLREDDPVLGEWDVVVLSPQFSAALLARDLGDTGPDMDRMFEYALTYDRHTVTRAAHGLLARVAPATRDVALVGAALPAPALSTAATPTATAHGWVAPAGSVSAPLSAHVVRRALAETTTGLSIADMTRPDHPLVFVNAAFERLAGFCAEELVGRNCRFLQGADTDRAATARIREAISAGREARELLLNYRGSERVPWWNEVHLSPVRDDRGRVVQYMAVQSDVTRRVEAERALAVQGERARSYFARIEELAYTDSLTGLMNRRRFETHVEEQLVEAADRGHGVALLFLDLNGFKAVNDTAGHAVGDQLLRDVAARLGSALHDDERLARFGGDEFVLVRSGLDAARVREESQAAARRLARTLERPFDVAGEPLAVRGSIGVACYPDDARSFGALLHLADLRMYALKHPTTSATSQARHPGE